MPIDPLKIRPFLIQIWQGKIREEEIGSKIENIPELVPLLKDPRKKGIVLGLLRAVSSKEQGVTGAEDEILTLGA